MHGMPSKQANGEGAAPGSTQPAAATPAKHASASSNCTHNSQPGRQLNGSPAGEAAGATASQLLPDDVAVGFKAKVTALERQLTASAPATPLPVAALPPGAAGAAAAAAQAGSSGGGRQQPAAAPGAERASVRQLVAAFAERSAAATQQQLAIEVLELKGKLSFCEWRAAEAQTKAQAERQQLLARLATLELERRAAREEAAQLGELQRQYNELQQQHQEGEARREAAEALAAHLQCEVEAQAEAAQRNAAAVAAAAAGSVAAAGMVPRRHPTDARQGDAVQQQREQRRGEQQQREQQLLLEVEQLKQQQAEAEGQQAAAAADKRDLLARLADVAAQRDAACEESQGLRAEVQQLLGDVGQMQGRLEAAGKLEAQLQELQASLRQLQAAEAQPGRQQRQQQAVARTATPAAAVGLAVPTTPDTPSQSGRSHELPPSAQQQQQQQLDSDRWQQELVAQQQQQLQQQHLREQRASDQQQLLAAIAYYGASGDSHDSGGGGGRLGFHAGCPVAALAIFRCCLQWKAFQAHREPLFDGIIAAVTSQVEQQRGNNACLAHWLSTTATLLHLMHTHLSLPAQTWGGAKAKAIAVPPSKQVARSLFGGTPSRLPPFPGRAASAAASALPGIPPPDGGSSSGSTTEGSSLKVEASYPALLFQQQLGVLLQRLFPMLRDAVKKELAPLLAACVQPPRQPRPRIGRRTGSSGQAVAAAPTSSAAAAAASTPVAAAPAAAGAGRQPGSPNASTAGGGDAGDAGDGSEAAGSPPLLPPPSQPPAHQQQQWAAILPAFDRLLATLRAARVPPFLARLLFQQLLAHVDGQLFNQLLLRRECCSRQNGVRVAAGLAEVDRWIAAQGQQWVGSPRDSLVHQAVAFLVADRKPHRTYQEVTEKLCGSLSVQQLYRLSTMYWEEDGSSQDAGVSAEALAGMKAAMHSGGSSGGGSSSSSACFMLDDDASLPFSLADVQAGMAAAAEAEGAEGPEGAQDALGGMPLPRQLQGHPSFAFLGQRLDMAALAAEC